MTPVVTTNSTSTLRDSAAKALRSAVMLDEREFQPDTYDGSLSRGNDAELAYVKVYGRLQVDRATRAIVYGNPRILTATLLLTASGWLLRYEHSRGDKPALPCTEEVVRALGGEVR